MNHRLHWILSLFLVTACSGPAKKSAAERQKDDVDQAKLDQGLKALDAQDYAEAARIFDRLLVQNPGTEMDLVATFNSGSAYFGLGDCAKASDRYRQVVRASAGKFRRIESEALYRLSLAYECLGQDAKTIAALIDAKKRNKDLSFEVVRAEIPARLAAAYARMGNREKSLQYFTQASNGLKVIVSRGYSPTQVQLLASTTYSMGQLSPTQRRAEVDPMAYLQSLSIQQLYLLQSLEIHRSPWSAKAEADLRLAYDNIWQLKVDESLRRDFYTRALQVIYELKKIRSPKSDQAEDQVFAAVDENEKRVRNELARVKDSTPLTSEAQRRQAVPQTGRLVDPEAGKNKNTEIK